MKFVIAVKREHRGKGVTANRVDQVPGVTIVGASNPDRVVVDASSEAVAELRRQLGSVFRIEPLIEHTLL